MGCHVADTVLHDMDKAVALAKISDAVILVVGLDQSQEREGLDRIETTLPGLQNELVLLLFEAQPNTILVLLNGGALSLGQDILDRAPAIVDVFYGGQAASRALAQVLFGGLQSYGTPGGDQHVPSLIKRLYYTLGNLNF